jgi:hypothetical protein
MRRGIARRSLMRCCLSCFIRRLSNGGRGSRWAAYEERFVVSTKQRARLDQWEKTDAAKLAVEDDGDVTTEEEMSDCYYHSDDSD